MTDQVVEDPAVAPVETGDKSGAVDYWGVDEKSRHYLPDGEQWIEFQIMNEGAKSRFQKLTNQDLVIQRDQSAKVRMDPAAERHTLIKESVTNWNLLKGGEIVGYSKQMLDKWLEVAPPHIVEGLEKAIRKANPWMQNDMTVELIDEQIEELYQLRKDVQAREAGEASSANK